MIESGENGEPKLAYLVCLVGRIRNTTRATGRIRAQLAAITLRLIIEPWDIGGPVIGRTRSQ